VNYYTLAKNFVRLLAKYRVLHQRCQELLAEHLELVRAQAKIERELKAAQAKLERLADLLHRLQGLDQAQHTERDWGQPLN
jgi:hypothetical protein